MASNRDIVEVPPFRGATDRFIAREIRDAVYLSWHPAGLVGALPRWLFLNDAEDLQALGGGALTMGGTSAGSAAQAISTTLAISFWCLWF